MIHDLNIQGSSAHRALFPGSENRPSRVHKVHVGFVRFFCPWIVKSLDREMPYPPHLLKHDNRHVSGNHLDVRVGTGYVLDHCQFPTKTPRLGLLDLNPTCLEMAAKRLARFQPTIFRANALEPIHIGAPRVRLHRIDLSAALPARHHSHQNHRFG